MFKKIILILALVCMIVFPVFSQTGNYTTHNLFYLPEYGAYGLTEYNTYNEYMEIADAQIWANKTAITAKQPLDAQLTDIAGLTPTDSNFIVGDGSNWVAESGSTARTSLGLVIGTDVQAYDAGLLSLAGLTYVSESFIKVTATDTYVIRTIAETKTDLSLNNVENTALSSWVGTANITTLGTIGTGTWQGTAIADGYIPNTITISDLQTELDAGAHSIGFTMQTPTGDGATLIDWRIGNHVKFTFGAQNETITFTSPTNHGHYSMIIVQDGTGSRTITWSGITFKWHGGVEPTLTTTANGEDVLGLIWDGTSWYGALNNVFATP